MANSVQDNIRGSGLSLGRAGGYIPRVRVEGSSPGGVRSALDRGAKRKQGVEKQFPDMLQLKIHRVYALFPPQQGMWKCFPCYRRAAPSSKLVVVDKPRLRLPVAILVASLNFEPPIRTSTKLSRRRRYQTLCSCLQVSNMQYGAHLVATCPSLIR